jgi:hypothetical protein
MKRRDFLKAPATWSPAKADAHSAIQLVVTAIRKMPIQRATDGDPPSAGAGHPVQLNDKG